MSQDNLGQIQPFEANPHPSLSMFKYDCDFELTAIWFEQPLTWKPCWCVHIYTEVGCCCFFPPERWQSTSCHMEVPDARPVQLCPGLLHSDHSGCYFCAWLSPREEHQLICAMHTTSSTNTDTAGLQKIDPNIDPCIKSRFFNQHICLTMVLLQSHVLYCNMHMLLHHNHIITHNLNDKTLVYMGYIYFLSICLV